jgi:hypothetical protein
VVSMGRRNTLCPVEPTPQKRTFGGTPVMSA